MGLIAWVEDAEPYVKDMIDELSERGHTVRVLGDCNSYIEDLKNIISESAVIILDLWLPLGAGHRVPEGLRSDTKSTDRGVWLCKRTVEGIRDLRSNTRLIVLSGNLDLDTIARLTTDLRLQKEYINKKPVEFEPFIELVDRLADVRSD